MVTTNSTTNRFSTVRQVWRRVTRTAPAVKSAYTGGMIGYGGSAYDDYYSDRDLRHDEYGYAKMYTASAWAFRALNIRAQKVASVLWRNGRVVDVKTGKAALKHPFHAALDGVFRYYKQDLYEEWQLGKSLYGETFIELVPMELFGVRTKQPFTFKLLNALAVEPVIVRGEVKEFRYSGDDNNQTYSVDELVFDRQYNPANDIRGLSLMVAALDAVNIERGQTRIARAMIHNNMRPGIIFTPKEGTVIRETDAVNIKKVIQEQGKGAQNSGRPLFIPFPFDVTAVAPPTFEDQEYLSEQQKRKIAAVVGIPVGMIDHTDSAFQLSPEQKRALYELTILPAAEKMARIVDTELLPFIDPSGQYRYELPSEEIMANLEDPGAVSMRVSGQFQAGYVSFNEARARQNLDPIAGGDWYALPAGIVPVKAADIASAGAILQDSRAQAMPTFGIQSSNIPAPRPSLDTVKAAMLQLPATTDKPGDDELKTWRKFALKHGADKAQRFVCNVIDDATAEGIRTQLAAVEADDEDALKAVFDGINSDPAQKAIQATRLNFESDCADLLAAATSGSIVRASFSNKMRALIRNYGRDAYRDGLTDGGIEEPGFDDDDVETINRMVTEQSIYVTSLGMALFRGSGITPAQEDNKPAMWYRKSIEPFYKAGLGAADRNGLYEWVLGNTEEHCDDCLRLNGQKHRMKDWMRRNLIPQSDKLACGGWQCDCKLVKTTGKTKGDF